ncbi:MAG: choice-of-anchor D domain-containing protein [Bacteroidetes bacterium]|nr:choice-of-anchor D domain-containing protein [Bacteroidota bacterium]
MNKLFALAGLILCSVQASNAASRFWISASNSNWNNTSNWSATSGGAGGAAVPGANDTAYFDGVSGANGNCGIDANVTVAGIRIDGYTGTISQNAFTMTMGIKGFYQNSGTFTGSSSAFTINSTGVFTLAGGSFTATSGNFTITGSRGASQTIFTHSAGTFSHNGGTVVLNPQQPGCSQITYTADVLNTTVFNNLTFNATPSCGINAIITSGLADVLTASGTITHTDGIFNGWASFEGNLIVGAAADGGTGTIAANGTSTQTYTYTAGGRTAKIEVNKSSGSFDAATGTTALSCQGFNLAAGTFNAPTGSLNVGGTLTTSQTVFSHSGGTFNHNNGTVSINPNQPSCSQLTFTVDVIPATLFGSLQLNATPSCGINPIITSASGDVLTCDNDVTHTDGIFSGNISFKGNLVVSNTADGGTGIFTAEGNANQTYAFTTGGARTCQLVVNKSGGSLSAATGTTDLSIQAFTLTAGTFNAPTGTLNIGGTWTTSQTLFTHTAGTFNHNSGTVNFNPNQPSCTQLTFTADVSGTTVFNNVTVQATPSCGINPIFTTATGDVINAVGNFTHTDGIFNGQLSFEKDLNIASTSDGGSGTITADGSSFQYYTYSSGAARTCKIVVNKPSGVLAPATGVTDLSAQSFTLQQGHFVAPSGTFNIGGTWATSQTLFTHTGGYFDHNSGTVLINPNQPSCTQLTFTLDVLPGIDFYNLTINATPSCGINPIVVTASGDVPNVANTLTHTDGILNGTFTLKKDLVIASTSDGGTGVVTVDGNGAQTYTFPTGGSRTCKIVVNKPTGSFGPAVGTTDFSIQALAIQSGDFKAPTGVLNIGGTWTVNTIIFQQTGGTFTHNGGTTQMNPNQPSCTQLTFTMDVANNTVFNNLNLNATPSCGINAILAGGSGDTVEAVGTLTYTNGICNAMMEASGNVTVTSGYDGGTGKLIFAGGNNQTFDLTGATNLFDANINVNKTGGAVTLNSVCTMDGAGQSLNLVSGNINTTSANLLRVNRTVGINGGSASSFVDGPMVRMVAFNGATSGLLFPIGKGGKYRQAILNVTHNAATNFDYTGEVVNTSAQTFGYTLPGSIDNVSPIRYWQIDRSAAGNLTAASLQLFYGSDDGVTNNTNLRIAQGTGGNWVDLGGSGTANTSGSITSSVNFTSFSPFTLANATGGTNFEAQALNFDGTNDHVVATGYSTMTAYTIEAWVKLNSTSNQNIILASDGAGPTSNWSHQIRFNGGKFEHYTYDGGTKFVVGSTTASTGQWYHVAITATNGGVAKLFINGTEEGTPAAIGTLWTSMNRFYIGSNSGFSMGYLNGELDQVRIWNYARTCSEIRSDMNHELTGSESGLMSYYHFNQGIAFANNSGVTTLNDIAGTAQNGTLTNFALSGNTSNWVTPGSGASGTTTDPQPEINLKGNGNSITDGDVSPSTADHTDFDNVAINSSFARTFTIENTGSGPMTVSSITVTGTHASLFTLGTMTPSGAIPASGTATITVTFLPTTTGLKTATLNIFSNDCDEATYDFALQGTGVTPAASLNMDGSNDYITVGNPSALNFGNSSPITIEAWVRAFTGATNDEQIVSKIDGSFKGYGLQIGNTGGRSGKVEFYLIGNYGANQALWIRTNYGDIRDNNWHHIAATYDGSSNISGLHIYIDGVDYGSTATASGFGASSISNTANLHIGSYHAGGSPGEYLLGDIDEVRIWNRNICQGEIAAMRNCEISINKTGLLANYHFNQGEASGTNTSVTSLTDATSNALNGTLTNFALTGGTSNWVTPGAVTSGVSCANLCDSTSTVPTAAGTYTSAMSYTSPTSGFTHYCDCQGNLLLSVNLTGSGAVVADNAVSLKINSAGAVFYPQHTGFVGNTFGYAAMDRTWDVAATTQPNKHVPVRFYFNNSDYTAVNNALTSNSLPGLYSVNNMNFWKVINDTKPAHSQVPNLNQWDVKVIMHGSNPTDSTWVLGNRGAGNYFAQFKVWGFSGGGGGSGPLGLTPLPAELLYLNAVPVNNQFITVKWGTASEINLNSFLVERSLDGKNWLSIGSINAKGNSLSRNDYSINDYQVVAGKTYFYRLRLKSADGSFDYSHVVSARLNGVEAATLSVFPNPADKTLSIIWPEGTDEAQMQLHSSDGKLIWTRSMNANLDKTLDVSNLTPGVYLLSTTINGERVQSRIMIQR